MIGPPTRPDVWAKSGDGYWHPLLAHSADVAASFERLITSTAIGDRFNELFGGMSQTTEARLCVLAALHDAGKANRFFQNNVYGGPTATHQSPLVYLLRNDRGRLARLGVEEMHEWFEGVGYQWLDTTWAHHGSPLSDIRPGGSLSQIWDTLAMDSFARLREAVEMWYPAAFDGDDLVPDSMPAQHLFNGVLTLADWIASDSLLFPWKQREDADLRDPAVAKDVADRRAAAAFDAIGMTPRRPTTTQIEAILEDGHVPYKVQQAVRNAPAPSSGSLVVLESPTGSGKTEGALGRFARLSDLGLVDSLFFAAPLRTAAKQLHARVCEAMEAFYGENVYPHLAIPGYIQAGSEQGFYAGKHQVRWDDDAIGRLGWAAETSRRFTASPIAVGTTDQVLLAALKNRHAHLRAAGLSRSLIVVDEVHASSTYMHKAMQRVIDLHLAAGGHAVLMSATLQTSVRAEYTGEDPKDLRNAKNELYPRVMSRTESGVGVSRDLDCPGRSKTVQIDRQRVVHDAGRVAQLATTAARKGARVLVIRNTVAACQDTFEHIPDELSFAVNGISAPHHSRYAAEDRFRLDARIEALYGDTPTRKSSNGVVTVATQTVEQSLDIDADLLITDLCPMDVLLQRIGRLFRHQHDYARPAGFEEARCIVLTTERPIASYINSDSGAAYALTVPGAGTVYSALHIKSTFDVLSGRADITIPEENREVVEESLHPETLDALARQAPFDKIKSAMQNQDLVQRVKASHGGIDWGASYPEQAFPSKRVPTRLGLMTILAELPEDVNTPLGHTTRRVPLSPFFFDAEELDAMGEDPRAEILQITSDGFTFTVVGRPFSYTATGIQKA